MLTKLPIEACRRSARPQAAASVEPGGGLHPLTATAVWAIPILCRPLGRRLLHWRRLHLPQTGRQVQ